MLASPEYLAVCTERDEALAQRDAALAMLERLLGELAELENAFRRCLDDLEGGPRRANSTVLIRPVS
jgi:hypothetical protein